MTPLTVIPERVKKNLLSIWRTLSTHDQNVALAALNADRSAESERVKGLVDALKTVEYHFGASKVECELGAGESTVYDKVRAALSAYEKGEKGQ